MQYYPVNNILMENGVNYLKRIEKKLQLVIGRQFPKDGAFAAT